MISGSWHNLVKLSQVKLYFFIKQINVIQNVQSKPNMMDENTDLSGDTN